MTNSFAPSSSKIDSCIKGYKKKKQIGGLWAEPAFTSAVVEVSESYYPFLDINIGNEAIDLIP